MDSTLKDIWQNFKESTLEKADLLAWKVLGESTPEVELEVAVSKGNLKGVEKQIKAGAQALDTTDLIKLNIQCETSENKSTRLEILNRLLGLSTELGENNNKTGCLANAIVYNRPEQTDILAKHMKANREPKPNILEALTFSLNQNKTEAFEVALSHKMVQQQWSIGLFQIAAQKGLMDLASKLHKLGADPTYDGKHIALKRLDDNVKNEPNKTNEKNVLSLLKLYSVKELKDLKNPQTLEDLGLSDWTKSLIPQVLESQELEANNYKTLKKESANYKLTKDPEMV